MSKLHKKTGHACIICDDVIENNNGFFLHKTRRQTHKLCNECGERYMESIFSKIINNCKKFVFDFTFKCPGTYHSLLKNKCCKNVNILHLNISREYFKIFTKSVIIKQLYLFNNLQVCIKNNCLNIIDKNNFRGCDMIMCDVCRENWCDKCKVSPYHKNISCLENEILENKTENGKYLAIMKETGKLKFCPTCKTPTIKMDGCNKIVCSSCEVKWCWLCQDISIDYSHFNSFGQNPCANRLWEDKKTV